jgi:signal transduction histidine kinase
MSIRLRLTIWYSSILLLTLIIFSVALYFTQQQVTLSELRVTLKNETQRLLASNILLPDTRYGTQTYVQTLDLDGRITGQTKNLGDGHLPLTPAGLTAVADGQQVYETASVNGENLLIYSKTIRSIPRPMIVQVARSLEGLEQSLNTLRKIVIIGTSIATVLAFGVGWMLAGFALRPIDRITQTAQAIGADRDFSQRVSYTGPLDEIGRLATTLNEMLGALQAAYIQEAHALQAQRRFVADASHELRTPLTTVRGNIGLLQRDPPISNEDRVAVLADMVDESERMSRLVNDLLVLARADAGRPLRSEPVAIQPLIEEMCRKARLLSPKHTIRCGNVPPAAIIGDSDALKQVLLILIDNAIKFTPPTGSIELTAAVHDERVTISVRDTGVGISPAALPHIFERFYRGDASRTGSGAGLGLAIAKTLVEGQQGAISVASAAGQGSTFTVSLPQAVALPPVAAPAELPSTTTV